MEIDFMGLYSNNSAPAYDPTVQNDYDADPFVDSGIGSGESIVSLSLCTSSSIDEKQVFPDFLRKKMRMSPAENMNSICIPARSYGLDIARPREQSRPSSVGKPILRPSGFPYHHNNISTMSRDNYPVPVPVPVPASTTVFHPTAAPNSIHARKTGIKMYATGDAPFEDTRKSTDGIKIGYTPTVAMARRATLARFLEKRSHRLNQKITPKLMGRSLNWSEACDTTTTFTARRK